MPLPFSPYKTDFPEVSQRTVDSILRDSLESCKYLQWSMETEAAIVNLIRDALITVQRRYELDPSESDHLRIQVVVTSQVLPFEIRLKGKISAEFYSALYAEDLGWLAESIHRQLPAGVGENTWM